MKNLYLVLSFICAFFTNHAMEFQKDLQNIYQGIHVCKELAITDIVPLESKIESASDQITAYVIAAHKMHAWVPIEWHQEIAKYVYLLRIGNKMQCPNLNLQMNLNQKVAGIDYTFVHPKMYIVSNDITLAIQKCNTEEIDEDWKKYSYNVYMYWESGNLCCYCDLSSLFDSANVFIKEKDVIDVQCDEDSDLCWTGKNGTKMSIIGSFVREGNHIRKPVVQEKGRFCTHSKNGITFIWDKKNQKSMGNVHYQFGFLQDLEVLFCSPQNGLILHCPLMNLLYVFKPTKS